MSSTAFGRALPLSRWERALGLAIGVDPDAPALDRQGAATPRAAIAEAVAAALRQPPCLVSFSGGRDSSVVLALAASEARRLGLPSPVPCTLRFPAVSQTEESDWQERVIAHLGLEDWVRIPISGELDFLGATARQELAEHGHLYPPNAHFHAPIFERAAGGSVMTGFDGDGLLVGWRWHHAQAVLHGRTRPVPRDVLRVGLAVAPRRVRRAVLARDASVRAPWLRPQVRAEVTRLLTSHAAAQPRRWDRRLDEYVRTRFLRLPIHSLDLLAERHDVQVLHPLADRRFLAALAREGGAAGYGDRTAATRALFGDLLPEEVLTRPSKAEFGFALWGEESLAFARGWDGGGFDPDLVDAEALREAWAEPNPDFAAATLLQGAWLATLGPSQASAR